MINIKNFIFKKPFFLIYGILFIAHCSLFMAKAQQLRMIPCGAAPSCLKNTVFHETNTNFGNFNYNSVNFDHLLLCRPVNNISLRIGAIYMTFPKVKAYGMPLAVNFMFGRSYNQFEAGIGLTYLYFDKDYDSHIGKYDVEVSYAAFNSNIGFRHQNADGGLFYRAGLTPMFSLFNNDKISVLKDKPLLMMAGVSIGWTFKQ